MIINTLQNLELYSNTFANLKLAVSYLKSSDLCQLQEGKNEISEDFYIVKNIGEKKSDFNGILEVHRDWIDIHIPLTDDEIIVYKALSDCSVIEKEYDKENDYMLYQEDDLAQVVVPKGYFCVIDTSMCHMAMLGEGRLEKLIMKIRK